MTYLEKQVLRYHRHWGAPDEPDKSLQALPHRGKRYIKRKLNGLKNRINPEAPAEDRTEYGKRLMAEILPDEEKKKQEMWTQFKEPHLFSVIVPLYNTPENFLREMIDSVINQTYKNWELCLADGSDDEHAYVGEIVKEYQRNDARVKYKKLEKNLGISGNTNACLEFSAGDYVSLFDHDDLLHPSALFECQKAIEETGADCLYTDELTFVGSDINLVATVHLKPDFSPQSLNGVNYICHLFTFKKSLLEGNGLYRTKYDGSQDHDMILRVTSAAKRIEHIKKLLYFWRIHPGSVSGGIEAKSYAIDAGKKAVQDSERRKGRNLTVSSVAICATHYRLHYIQGMESYDTITIEKNDTGKTLNEKVKASGKDYILFVSPGTQPIQGTNIRDILQYAILPEIGLAAGRLLDGSGRIKESGYITGLGEDGIILPVDIGEPFDSDGYMGRHYYVHNMSAATLDGSMIRKEAFLDAGGFDDNLKTPRALGLDISLKLLNKGYYNVVNPFVLYKKGGSVSGLSEEEKKYFKATYKDVLEKCDPYYHPLMKKDGTYRFYMD